MADPLQALIAQWRQRAAHLKAVDAKFPERFILEQCADDLAALCARRQPVEEELLKVLEAARTFLRSVEWNDNTSEMDAANIVEWIDEAARKHAALLRETEPTLHE